MRVCRSPWLIAAYHGLHRLRVPRHPPHAFTRLTTTICDQAERLQPLLALLYFISSDNLLRLTFALLRMIDENDVSQ